MYSLITKINTPSGGSRGGARGAASPTPIPPIFLDQTEARRTEKKIFFETGPPLMSGY